MEVDIIMPQLGESIAEGTILKWHKKIGDRIEKDENIFEITTDKIDSEIPSAYAGRLSKILVLEGQVVKVGTVVAIVEAEADMLSPTFSPHGALVSSSSVSAAIQRPIAPLPASPLMGGERGGGGYSPAVLALAREQGIKMDELERISGTGNEGRITKQDVAAYVASRAGSSSPVVAKPGEEVLPMDRVKKSMADHMVKSLHTSAHTFSVSEADFQAIVTFREQQKQAFEAKHGVKLTYTHFVAYAVVQTLHEFPFVNCSLDGDKVILKKYVNLGVAVATDRGLLVPVVKGAEKMSFVELAKAISEISEKAKGNKLAPDDVHGGTITITNNGTFGNIIALPIINQPQVAILAYGAIKKRPVAVGDQVVVHPVMYLTLAYDHRIVDGATGGGCVQKVADMLQEFKPFNI